MKSLQSVQNAFESQLRSVGKEALATLYDDLQGSLLQFELVDHEFNTVEIFTFPINPELIIEEERNISSVKRTNSAVVNLKDDGFKPKTITIGGTFGRSFKVVVNEQPLEVAGVRLSLSGGKLNASFNKEKTQFSSFAKTGFGCLQLLYQLYERHNQTNKEGKPYYLILYSSTLKRNYIVNTDDIKQTNNVEQYNMLPRYDISMTAVAAYDQNVFANSSSVAKRIGRMGIQRSANSLLQGIKRAVNLPF